MKTKLAVALFVLAVLSEACQSSTPTLPPTPAGLVETQVAATISAGQTSTAAIEQAVKLTLTAAVPSATNTLPPSPTSEPTTAVPPTNTPLPTATKKPVPTQVPPTRPPASPTAAPPTLAPTSATEAANWAVSFVYNFPVPFWTVGTHQYTLSSACSSVPDLNGTWTNSFQV
ncbi:MAG TPA: hypothetical protein VJL59_16210, partial [Anaerolineales bacterium]|nr:hypothetical protein [Anaerolineales bacterium]